jgi:hypothetical protein
MTSTQVATAPGVDSRRAPGHDARLQPAKPWQVPPIEGGGSVKSTVTDLLTFIAALGAPDGPVAAALPVMLHDQRSR